jgi:hypothetical protein
MIQDAIELGLVPLRHRNGIWASRKAIPDLFDEVEPLRWRKLENLIQKLLGRHRYKMGSQCFSSKSVRGGLT